MVFTIGQIVLTFKRKFDSPLADILGRARSPAGGQNVRMAWENEAAFNEALRGRIRELREAGPWNQEQMAEALGIPAERYRKYETRSPMPPYLIQRFASIVGKDAEFVLTGKAAIRRKRSNQKQPSAARQDPPL